MATTKRSKAIREDGATVFRRAFPQAHSLWFAKIPGGIMTLEAFALGKTIVIIQDYGNGDGWNAFTPTTDDGHIGATFEAIALRANAEMAFENIKHLLVDQS